MKLLYIFCEDIALELTKLLHCILWRYCSAVDAVLTKKMADRMNSWEERTCWNPAVGPGCWTFLLMVQVLNGPTVPTGCHNVAGLVVTVDVMVVVVVVIVVVDYTCLHGLCRLDFSIRSSNQGSNLVMLSCLFLYVFKFTSFFVWSVNQHYYSGRCLGILLTGLNVFRVG